MQFAHAAPPSYPIWPELHQRTDPPPPPRAERTLLMGSERAYVDAEGSGDGVEEVKEEEEEHGAQEVPHTSVRLLRAGLSLGALISL